MAVGRILYYKEQVQVIVISTKMKHIDNAIYRY